MNLLMAIYRHPRIRAILLLFTLAGLLWMLVGCAARPRISGVVSLDNRVYPGEIIMAGEFFATTNILGEYTIFVQEAWSGTIAIPYYGPEAIIAYANLTSDQNNQNWRIATSFWTIDGYALDDNAQPAVPIPGLLLENRATGADGRTWGEDLITDENGFYSTRAPKGYSITVENYTPPVPVPEPPDGGAV